MISLNNKKYKLLCILISGLLGILTTAGAKPTLSFSLPPAFRSLPAITSLEKRQNDVMKEYTGYRERNDTLLMIYHHDLTIAIIELGPNKLLVGCELIEIYKDDEGEKFLKKLSLINKPFSISFKEMVKLMIQCQMIDVKNSINNLNQNITLDNDGDVIQQAGIFSTNPISLLSGILPGTKWCGTGDIAESYHDLGTEPIVDRCCRTHDICPTKVRAYQKRYNLSNNSLYTKSHCTCDDMLFSCLKKSNSSSAQLMGTIYFNLIQVPCVIETDKKGEFKFRTARKGF